MMASNRSQGLALNLCLFAFGRALVVSTLFLSADVLVQSQMSLLSYTTILLAVAAVVLLSAQQAWSSLPHLPRTQLPMIAINGALNVLSYGLFAYGIKQCGPIRAVLMESFEHLVAQLPLLLCASGQLPQGKRRGSLFMLAALCILLIAEPEWGPWAQAVAAASAGDLSTGTVPAVATSSSAQSGSTLGTMAMLLAVALGLVRAEYAKKRGKHVSGAKRLYAISLGVGALLTLPATLLRWIVDSVSSAASPSPTAILRDTGAADPSIAAASATLAAGGGSYIVPLVVISCAQLVLAFFVTVLGQRVENARLVVHVDLGGSLLVAAAIASSRYGMAIHYSTLAAALLIAAGVHQILGSDQGGVPGLKNMGRFTRVLSLLGLNEANLPDYAPTTAVTSAVTSSWDDSRDKKGLRSISQLWLLYKHIAENRDTWRIFVFLCINFMFMFIELIYGFITNSLGLISDAGHMLFDCAALFIGLYASYVSKIKANSVYTFGYARYEVLSGYVNGVFLLFIGVFVFVESIERLFEPPDIHSENLILVSCLGFGVNMIGLVFFHEHAHGHSHGGHGHSHGGGHGHSHGGGHSHSSDDGGGHSHDGQACDGQHHDDHGHSHGPVISSSGGSLAVDHSSHGHSHSHDEKECHDHSHGNDHGHDHSHGGASCDHGHSHGDDHHGHSHDHDHDHKHEHEQDHSQGGGKFLSGLGMEQEFFEFQPRKASKFLNIVPEQPVTRVAVKPAVVLASVVSAHDRTPIPALPVPANTLQVTYRTSVADDAKVAAEEEAEENHNLRGIFLHVLADALGSVGVIISSLLIHYFQWYMADALCSIFISVLICGSVLPLIRNSGRLLLQRTPASKEQKLKNMLRQITSLPGIKGYRDAHLWEHTTSLLVGTLHVHVADTADEQAVRAAVTSLFTKNFSGQTNFSIQIEKEHFLSRLDASERMSHI